jgi:hypothetical protein
VNNTVSEDSKYRYTGLEYDEDTGLNNFRARLWYFLLFASILVLTGCSMVTSYSYDAYQKVKVANSEISVFVSVVGYNPENDDDLDSVDVSHWLIIQIPNNLCDTLVIENLKWISAGNEVLDYSSNPFSYKNNINAKNFKYDIAFKKSLPYLDFVTIPKTVRESSLIINARFLKDGVMSKSYELKVPINIEKHPYLRPWDP